MIMISETLSLFSQSADVIEYVPADDRLIVVSGNLERVKGLAFFPQFVTFGEERVLLWEADREGEWSTHWSRRTKSFGSAYLHGLSDTDVDRSAKPLPQWSDFIRLRLVEDQILARLPNQMGINEYMPGQGIAQHVDYFGGSVASLTLGSGCIMDFTDPERGRDTVSIWLPRRSIVVLTGEARNIWRHGIRGRLKDIVDGHVVRRNRRVSLTFRDVILN